MDSVTLENFRCFREPQTARLAPLTLLVGENSTGKTSFMAMLRALWDVAYGHRVPDFKEDPYDLGSFDEIAHHRGGRADSFTVGFAFADGEQSAPFTTSAAYRFDADFEKKGTVPIPVRRRLSWKGSWIEECRDDHRHRRLRFGTRNGSWQFHAPFDRGLAFEDDSDWLVPFFAFLRDVPGPSPGGADAPPVRALAGSAPPTNEDWKQIEHISRWEFGSYEDRPYASAPVRSKPHRTSDPARPTWDPEGNYIPMYFANVHFQDRGRWNALKNALEVFGQRAGLFDEISVKPLGTKDSGPFQVQIRKYGRRSKGPQRNLIDVGYGVSQVLPVVTELLRPDAPAMFLLQQPEVHLHPSAQAALGSLFCEVAGTERQLVVETHSDHLLDRVRMDVRDGAAKLHPEDVSILFFERGDLDVRIHSLRFDGEGNMLDAPDGYQRFFLEETARSLWKRSL